MNSHNGGTTRPHPPTSLLDIYRHLDDSLTHFMQGFARENPYRSAQKDQFSSDNPCKGLTTIFFCDLISGQLTESEQASTCPFIYPLSIRISSDNSKGEIGLKAPFDISCLQDDWEKIFSLGFKKKDVEDALLEEGTCVGVQQSLRNLFHNYYEHREEAAVSVDWPVPQTVNPKPIEFDALDRTKYSYDLTVAFTPPALQLEDDKVIGDFLRKLVHVNQSFVNTILSERKLRKHAIRTGVSAIMGRNMSHNIGSHVLARYSSKVRKDNEPADERNFKDHREVFLRYLQRRMDFIADVATADQSFWSQALSLERVLSAMNYEQEFREIDGNEKRIPILLSFITGKERLVGHLSATVDVESTGDHYFACPSGEVGVHALYVVLENIIRNSARHNDDSACQVIVRVKIEEDPRHLELWKLTLIDVQTPIRRRSRDGHGQQEMDVTKRVDNDINDKLRTRFLSNDGTPDPRYWGLREMQVCAQYLRNLPLSDLERTQPDPPVLEAVADESDHLAFELYVPRARLCIFVFTKSLVTREQKEIFRQKGFAVISADDLSYEQLALAVRGYAYAAVDEEVWTVQQKRSISSEIVQPGSLRDDHQKASTDEIPRRYEVRTQAHWVRNLDWPVRTLCLPTAELNDLQNLLVNALQSTAGQKSDSFRPMAWLEEHLHSKLAIEYQGRRNYLTGCNLGAKVGWDDECNITTGSFRHVAGDKLFSGSIYGNSPLLGWYQHAKASHFTSKPYLSAAAKDVIEKKPDFPDRKIRSWIYAEVFNSYSPHYQDLQLQRNGTLKGNELLAAALARVAIIDDRVQGDARGKFRSEIQYETLWPCMGVWVPSKVIADLNNPDFAKICAFLRQPAKREEQKPIDFVVLHLTILEKLAQQRACDEGDALNALVQSGSLAATCEVMIITGRGVPAIARHERSKRLNARYLPLSALLEYLVSNPSKLALMRALWSAATSKPME